MYTHTQALTHVHSLTVVPVAAECRGKTNKALFPFGQQVFKTHPFPAGHRGTGYTEDTQVLT